MPTITFDLLRWFPQPVRITIALNGGPPQVYFQITAPREVAALCQGRPVEELPRILSVLSPAHHLCAAQALDQLFGVEPPPLALNLREAWRQAYFFRHHLRKFYFLLTSLENPFQDFWSPEARRGPLSSSHLVDDLMHHVSLAQEAATILGGRPDHPLTAVAGGVSHFLKEDHYLRLAEIAAACQAYALRLGEFLREQVFAAGQMLAEVQGMAILPLASLSLAPASDRLILRDGGGQEMAQFAAANLFDKIGLHRETWTYEPFAFLKEKGWQELGAEAPDHLFFVGALARLNGGEPLATPRAEAERQRLVAALGPFPHFGVVAAYWVLLVELLEAAERMVALYEAEKLTGPDLRTIPAAPGREGYAALEAPEGLIYHHFQTDARGLVREVQVLDTATENNGLYGLLTQKAVETFLAQQKSWEETKKRIELSLLAF
jgi:F420-non-reducing hydrogenase large subunit